MGWRITPWSATSWLNIKLDVSGCYRTATIVLGSEFNGG
jgi:hypothetical protein